ncbi:MAG: PepSY domain-containing protein [Gammaproteobacteria bacterium]|nr:PepSY domain-containing protein [Gammaproteobacteria bacterium]MDH5731525.1 PepSY domain-containing protein [Gammaproteobacteria bacterium]
MNTLFKTLVIFLLLGYWGLANADHEEAFQLKMHGDVLGLEEILKKVRQKFDGRILEVELESSGGKLIYELELLDKSGVVVDLVYDAITGELIKQKKDD